MCQRTGQEIVSREHSAQVSNGGLKETDGLVVVALAPVNRRNIPDDFIHDMWDLHDQRSRKSICRTSTPSISRVAERVVHGMQLIVRKRISNESTPALPVNVYHMLTCSSHARQIQRLPSP